MPKKDQVSQLLDTATDAKIIVSECLPAIQNRFKFRALLWLMSLLGLAVLFILLSFTLPAAVLAGAAVGMGFPFIIAGLILTLPTLFFWLRGQNREFIPLTYQKLLALVFGACCLAALIAFPLLGIGIVGSPWLAIAILGAAALLLSDILVLAAIEFLISRLSPFKILSFSIQKYNLLVILQICFTVALSLAFLLPSFFFLGFSASTALAGFLVLSLSFYFVIKALMTSYNNWKHNEVIETIKTDYPPIQNTELQTTLLERVILIANDVPGLVFFLSEGASPNLYNDQGSNRLVALACDIAHHEIDCLQNMFQKLGILVSCGLDLAHQNQAGETTLNEMFRLVFDELLATHSASIAPADKDEVDYNLCFLLESVWKSGHDLPIGVARVKQLEAFPGCKAFLEQNGFKIRGGDDRLIAEVLNEAAESGHNAGFVLSGDFFQQFREYSRVQGAAARQKTTGVDPTPKA